MKFLHGARTRQRLLVSRRATETRMEREFQFHIDMHTEMPVREQGLTRREARRRALAAFGGVEKYKEALATDAALPGCPGCRLISGWARARWRSIPASRSWAGLRSRSELVSTPRVMHSGRARGRARIIH